MNVAVGKGYKPTITSPDNTIDFTFFTKQQHVPIMSPSLDAKLSTLTVHGDDDVNTIPSSLSREVTDVAPALHVSTTFRYSSNPDELVEAKDVDVSLRFTLARQKDTQISRVFSLRAGLRANLFSSFPILLCLAPRRQTARNTRNARLFTRNGAQLDSFGSDPLQGPSWKGTDLFHRSQRHLCCLRAFSSFSASSFLVYGTVTDVLSYP